MYKVVRRWLERIRNARLNREFEESASFLSSAFSMNDPLMAKLDRHRKHNRQCILILLHIENYSQMFYPGHYEQLASAERIISRNMREVLPGFFAEEHILGFRHMNGEQYCVFLQVSKADTFLDLHYKTLRLKNELEKRLADARDLLIEGPLKFSAGFYAFEKEPVSTKLAVSIAYHYAQSIATAKLPIGFSHTRQELLAIMSRENINVLAQPIMDLNSGDIFGWEMLARGPVDTPFYKPSELFEFAYQADLLGKLEMIVIKKAFREIVERSIREQVFINITSLSLAQTKYYNELVDYLSLFPSINPKQIIFEITERHSIRDYHEMAAMMAKYRKLGFRFAIDDAGAGYASLQTISELIPDMIKIDRSLIQNIDHGKVKQSLLKALMQFAQEIECEVIAEGIEREEEADMLYQHAVTKAQGYYFAKPAPLHHGGGSSGYMKEVREKIRLRARTSDLLA